jgi:WD40 repeat protein
MVSGCKNDIKVWKVKKGKLVDNKILKGHNDQIYCLIFSKKYNWFASCSGDKTIRGWKE